MPLTDRDGSNDEPTDLGEIVVSAFRRFMTELPATAFGPEPYLGPPSSPEPPQPTPRQAAVIEIITAMRAAQEAGEDIELTPELRELMQIHNIGLQEILTPGIYQFEFATGGAGEHRQWVRVTPTGTEIISGHSNGSSLDVYMNQSYEANTAHGRDSATGSHRIFAVVGTYDTPAALDARWAAMEAAAATIAAQGLNYHVFQQNSNSVFNTVGNAGNIEGTDRGWHWAPAADVDLTTRNGTNQPQPLSVDGFNVWSGGSESDVRTGESGSPNVLQGGAGNDGLTGGTAYDSLFGGDGDDMISSLGGYVEGGAGADTITASGTAASYISGDAGDDVITGSGFDDVIDGGDGNDHIQGGQGDDRLWGGTGVDQLHGGDGSDLIVGGEGDDFIYGGAGNDILSGTTGVDTIDGGAGDDAIYGGRDASSGDMYGDSLSGGDGNDVIYGSAGADTIYGGQGNDLIFGGLGGDNLWGGAGADVFKMTTSADSTPPTYNPYVGVDVIHDFEVGVDKLDFSEIDIKLWSPTQIDKIHWWTEGGSTFVAWTLMGGINQNASPTMLVELAGVTDFSWADLKFSNENLTLTGYNFVDNLRGLDGNDVISGGGGNDVITGGVGADTMTGGAGADAFIYYHTGESTVSASDLITDLSAGDWIDLSAIDADVGAAGNQGFSFVSAFTGAAGQAVRSYDASSNLTSLSMDVNGDGIADMMIRMNGDQSAFTGFVL